MNHNPRQASSDDHHPSHQIFKSNAPLGALRGSDGVFLVITKINPDSRAGRGPRQAREIAPERMRSRPDQNFQAMGATWTASCCPVGDGTESEANAHTGTPPMPD